MTLTSKLVAMALSLAALQVGFAAEDELTESEVAQSCTTPCAPRTCPPQPCKPPCPPVCFERGYPNDKSCFPPAYNEPASYHLAPCSWDYWFDASFTYWDAEQEGLDLAVATTELSDQLSPVNRKILFQKNGFKPGFKLGLGMDLDHDDWSAFAEYTWFRSTTHTNQSAPADARGGTPVWALSNWFITLSDVAAAATNLSSTWHLNMDLVDAGITRPFIKEPT